MYEIINIRYKEEVLQYLCHINVKHYKLYLLLTYTFDTFFNNTNNKNITHTNKI
jgi:hypothetical protein